ncbi:hypothetical protein HY496_01195 [Candidatus Woesearchaeota archaeon]|nr:hypothetical protein [Candidatus Woesearchaeota archaeon]
MDFLENLMTRAANVIPNVLPDYTLYSLPHDKTLELPRLRTLQNPGDRRSYQKVIDCLGVKPMQLEVYSSNAFLPFILPSADQETGLPLSLTTFEINREASLEDVLYDYIEGSRTRGNPDVLRNLLTIGRFPRKKEGFYLGNDFEFFPSHDTLYPHARRNDVIITSSVEKVVLNPSYDLLITFHVDHGVNLLREIMSFSLRYWIHDSSSSITHSNKRQRPVHGEFIVQRDRRGGHMRYGGSVGFVELSRGCKFKPFARFDQNGALIDPSTQEYLRPKDNPRGSIHCDFNNSLKKLVGLMSEVHGYSLAQLARIDYMKGE